MSLISCDLHDDCLVVYDAYDRYRGRKACPVCVLQSEFEIKEKQNEALEAKVQDLKAAQETT